MEASRKLETVADRLARLEKEFPQESHIWVNSPPRTLEVWPENYGLSHTPFKVPTDFMVATKSKDGQYESRSNGWIYESYGKWAFLKPTKLRIMNDAGIRPVRDGWQRLKEPNKPRFWGLEGVMGRLTINGMLYTRGEKWVSLDDGDFPLESLQTKLELWLGWKLVAIPQAFTMEELKAKTFVTFCIYPDPKPKNEAEHMLMLKHFLGIYEPAYPGASLPEPGTHKALPAPVAEVIDVDGAGDDDSEPAHDEPSPGGEVINQPLTPQKPQESPPPPASEKAPEVPAKPVTFIRAMQALKTELVQMLGNDEGETEYYKLLNAAGFKHCNEVTDRKKQGAIFRDLDARVKLLHENRPTVEAAAAAKPERNFMDDLLDMRREAFNRMAMDRLSEHLDELVSTCPANQYPPNITEIITTGDKAKMIDLAVELVRINLLEAARVRDQENAKRGGGR